MKEAIIYLVAIAVAEVITVFYLPLEGIIYHMVILVALIVHALATRYPHRPLLLSLALVPLVRIISLCMPLANIPLMWWFPIIYAPLLGAAIVVMRLLDYSREQVGLTVKWLPVQLVVGLTGVVFGIAEYFILRPEAMVAELTWQAIWLPAVILLLCTGFVEELIFRGVLQRAALEAFVSIGVRSCIMTFYPGIIAAEKPFSIYSSSKIPARKSRDSLNLFRKLSPSNPSTYKKPPHNLSFPSLSHLLSAPTTLWEL
ncbi:CPBP family intramembrane metalloprotease [Dehalococcoidia bacterium]|nr:CPBP family intramembrane metalloprotease [Dehalococcoidia bacterium]